MTTSHLKKAVVLFAKFPEPGRVKTRLAKKIGAKKACEIYTHFLSDLCLQHSNHSYDFIIAFTPAKKKRAFEFLLPSAAKGMRLYPQKGKNLGERMHDCFKNFLKSYTKVIIIGADLPQLDSATIRKAFQELEKSDVVLGPSGDGGYYLIGMKKAHSIFNGIVWSTDAVLSQQLKNIRHRYLEISLLEPRYDVDTWEDLMRLKRELTGNRSLKTSRFLATFL